MTTSVLHNTGGMCTSLRGNLVMICSMKNEIKQFVRVITRKRTRDIFHENITDVVRKDDHVVFFVDNAGPLHELDEPSHDDQIKKAVDHVCGEGCTYEVKIAKSNVIHERAKHVMRQKPPHMR